MPLQDSKDLQSILSIVKGFHSHPLECYCQNPWWSTWYSIFCHVNGGWSAKILCLPKNSWNPTDDQTLPMTSPWISLLPKLPLFAPQCTGIANQMTICPVARPWTHLSLLDSFFNLLVPPRCSFLTIAHHSKPFSPTTFSSWWNDCWSEQQPFPLDVLGYIRKLSELRWYTGCKLFSYFFVLQSLPFDPVSHRRPVGSLVWPRFRKS